MDPIMTQLQEANDASAMIDYIDREADACREEKAMLMAEWREQHSYSRIEG